MAMLNNQMVIFEHIHDDSDNNNNNYKTIMYKQIK